MFNWNQEEDWLQSVKSRYFREALSVYKSAWNLISNQIENSQADSFSSSWSDRDIEILSLSYGQRLTKCIHEDSRDFVHNLKFQEDFESRKFVSRNTDLYSTWGQGLLNWTHKKNSLASTETVKLIL